MNMSDSIDLFEPEEFIPNDPNVTFRPGKAGRLNKKAVIVYESANKRFATESVENVSAKKSKRISNEFNPSHRLSMKLDDRQGPSRLSSQLDNRLPTDKQSFPNLKERLVIQKEREMDVDTDNPQFKKFLKYGVRRDHNEWSLPRSLGDINIFNKKLKCCLSIAANFSSNLVVKLRRDLNQWRLKDRLPDKRKYVIYNHNLNALIKAPFGVVTAFPNHPNPLFSSHCNSQESIASSFNASFRSETKFKSCNTKIESTTTQTEPESSNFQADTRLTKSLWETQFTIAEFEQQNKYLLIEHSNLKVSLNCAKISRANAKINADCAESKLEISERVNSDLFEENKEVKQQLDEGPPKRSLFSLNC